MLYYTFCRYEMVPGSIMVGVAIYIVFSLMTNGIEGKEISRDANDCKFSCTVYREILAVTTFGVFIFKLKST